MHRLVIYAIMQTPMCIDMVSTHSASPGHLISCFLYPNSDGWVRVRNHSTRSCVKCLLLLISSCQVMPPIWLLPYQIVHEIFQIMVANRNNYLPIKYYWRQSLYHSALQMYTNYLSPQVPFTVQICYYRNEINHVYQIISYGI